MQLQKEIDEAVAIFVGCMAVYQELKKNGKLDKAGTEITHIYHATRIMVAEANVEVLRRYEAAGLSKEQAVALMVADKSAMSAWIDLARKKSNKV